ncbi:MULTISPECIES: putative bifunctional diguanylate cyclase/phosphodiesterase [Bacillus]|uniref:EAL domain-containing protein (Putative c-di-GMP-specific phosphodiesterase class I) n=1 Tax=Bacillus capparidis TaxID=1840411 RepID=A0ABS4CSS2_9BACI|nr:MULTISPECIES: EAL domain-containing protein [Bacillus]MBP1079812.1 EAL domain-containing protein (putative c-di-GMP-specific phosphodiesterase class I) [Bacillus capparidis]MED1095201.1 EAL domain-containing protein [Bacillus capparidis]
MEKELRSSLQQDCFYVDYQPKIHSVTKKMIGVEALARWIHPQKGVIPPSVFIPIAEKYGLINELEERVFKKICEHIKEWSDRLEFPFRVSVNISQLHFAHKNLYQFIKDTLTEFDIDARYLELEITESVMIMDDKYVIDQFSRIKQLGIEISMDDFGTGYSSLNYINKLPIDRIKIDKSFIDEIVTDQKFRSIIKTIVTMADYLELDVIAEGVEKEEQLTFLTSIDCFKIQGYFYSPPVQKEQISSFIYKQFKIA